MIKSLKAGFLLVMLASTSALACPVKKGFLAAGLVRQPEQVTPVCNELARMIRDGLTQPGSGLKFVEVFEAKKGVTVKDLAQRVRKLLVAKGYEKKDEDVAPDAVAVLMVRGKDMVSMSVFKHDGVVYLQVLGGPVQ